MAETHPFTTPPVSAETTSSYIARLAEVNGMGEYLVLSHIALCGTYESIRANGWHRYDFAFNPLAAQRLAAVSGPERANKAVFAAYRLWAQYCYGAHPRRSDVVQRIWQRREDAWSWVVRDPSLTLRFPEVVVLTEMICSPYWVQATSRPFTTCFSKSGGGSAIPDRTPSPPTPALFLPG
ncbi:hypothetical protein Q8791_30570 [Nocardiopsis sp. CT-R113]|uniref:Uncharacterized protein n=1 Tax=Nocardiopsis codii TaxID=3065942 RepID=A0ABU7KH56_9ACTN|nr:hypothetical protein [Nocardiopsis sp. CT-R113]MEE2041575.1 hypothetical protein [Nocardiopsis sp. CT-R113]